MNCTPYVIKNGSKQISKYNILADGSNYLDNDIFRKQFKIFDEYFPEHGLYKNIHIRFICKFIEQNIFWKNYLLFRNFITKRKDVFRLRIAGDKNSYSLESINIINNTIHKVLSIDKESKAITFIDFSEISISNDVKSKICFNVK